MNVENRWPGAIGRWLGKLLAVVGMAALLLFASVPYVAANNPKVDAIVEALNDIAAAIRDVAIQGEIGPQGPPGTPGPIADIYVRSIPSPSVVGGFGGSTVFCDPGDVATGGGTSCPPTGGCSSGSNGPFVSYAGPLLDETGMPVGWEFAMSNVTSGAVIARELYVVCSDISAL